MKHGIWRGAAGAFGLLGAVFASSAALAQSSTTYSSTNMWGVTPGGVSVNGALESAEVASVNSSVAAAVNAARARALISSGSPLTISSVGSQTIISNTVYGNNNPTNINAIQRSANSGSVTNQGTINSSQ